MPRKKLLREYAIRLNHPDIGEYYFNYLNTGSYYYSKDKPEYIFTQTLKKVTTWKQISSAEEHINSIIETLKSHKRKLYIPLTKEQFEGLNDNLKLETVCIKKRYYFEVKSAVSKHHLKNAKLIVERLKESMALDSENISDLIKKFLINNDLLDKNFMELFNNLSKDIKEYQKNYDIIKKHNIMNSVTLDIVDASYGFRYLKLKNLSAFKTEELEEELEETN